MRALVFRTDLPRLAAAKLGGYVSARAYTSMLGPLRLEDVADPELPARGWVRCDTVVSGICGSDAKQVFLNGSRDNPLTALISFPHVLGHEAVARREGTGELVVLDPWLGCVPRGIDPPCSACAEGNHPGCRSFTEGDVSAGLHLGNCASSPGTHADRFAAHASQLHAVPDGVTVEAAVLADPASVSLHSILKRAPDPARPALVYGCGTLGLCAIALLRHLHPALTIWAVSRPGRTAELALQLGANEVWTDPPDALVDRVARAVGAAPRTPWSKKEWLQDGPAVVYDTVGSAETVETALRFLATRGALVVSGVEAPERFEWTPIYFKEIELVGSNAFGHETLRGVKKHAYEHYFDLVREGLDLTPLVTHRFPLAKWTDAIDAIARRRETGAVKVLLEP
jgi:threonine dehydrogenase-like Zn-dependent dehydrogenase